MKPTVDQIKATTKGQWLQVLQALACELQFSIERLGKHVPCPVHGGKDGFRLFQDVAESGGGICNSCGPFADGIALLQWVNGWTFSRTLEMLSEHLGIGESTPTAPPISKSSTQPIQKDWSSEREWLDRVWQETIPDDGAINAYLEERGLSVDVPDSLRLHPGLRCKDSDGQKLGIFPAMICRFIRGEEMTGLHITFFNPDEPAKALIESPRRIWKCCDSISGSILQLFPSVEGQPLVIAEGVETALAIHELTNGSPVWAAGNAALMERATFPESANQILIATDKDRSWAGQGAGERLAERLHSEGRIIQLSAPPIPIPDEAKGVDWLDVLARKKGVAHVG